jgi:hypothetical protein
MVVSAKDRIGADNHDIFPPHQSRQRFAGYAAIPVRTQFYTRGQVGDSGSITA